MVWSESPENTLHMSFLKSTHLATCLLKVQCSREGMFSVYSHSFNFVPLVSTRPAQRHSVLVSPEKMFSQGEGWAVRPPAVISPIFLLLPKVLYVPSPRAYSCYNLCHFLTFPVTSLGFSFSYSLTAYLSAF